MNLLVTAGNTRSMIDRVRCITNIFTGRTGAALALEAHQRGHSVTLLTSHPETVQAPARFPCIAYRSFDELRDHMMNHIQRGQLDAVVHAAAVHDYECAGAFAPSEGAAFDPDTATWQATGPVRFVDRSAGKIKSGEPELWLRLVRAPKLVEMIREPWGFTGFLVMFKLEVAVTDEALLQVSEQSRRQARADLVVANTLEGAGAWAYLVSPAGCERVPRDALAARLIAAVEASQEEKRNG